MILCSKGHVGICARLALVNLNRHSIRYENFYQVFQTGRSKKLFSLRQSRGTVGSDGWKIASVCAAWRVRNIFPTRLSIKPCTEPQSIKCKSGRSRDAGIGPRPFFFPCHRSFVMGRKLFVGNLSFTIGEEELRQLFEQKGSVESVTVMRDQETGRSRGFGFVEMSSEEAAQKAIAELNGYSVDGRNLTVNEARPRRERGGGGFRGGSGGGRGGSGGRGRGRDPRW
jgi:cold-inducible RNA-binding protein